MNPIKTLLDALKANHQWHLDYDDHGGYAGSELEETNLKAIATATALVAVPLTDPKYSPFQAQGALADATATSRHFTLRVIYAAWHCLGIDMTGWDWTKFVAEVERVEALTKEQS